MLKLQVIQGLAVYVVDFDTMPELPITGEGEEEPYAWALDDAIRKGLITEPGKYGISVTHKADRIDYEVFRIIE